MPYSIQLPDGTTVANIPDNIPFDEAKKDILKRRPDLAGPSETAGVGEALKGALKRGLSTQATGIGALLNADKEAALGLQRAEDITEKPATSLEAVKRAYEQQGIFGGAKEALSQIPGAIAEQVPYIGEMAAGARLGAMAGSVVAPGVGTVIGGTLGAFAPAALSAFGSNVERQAAEKQQAGQPIQGIETGKAALAAVPQAAIDVGVQRLVFGKELIGKVLGRDLTSASEKATAAAAKKANALAGESIKRTLATGTAQGALAEIPGEISQQMLERWQAGKDLFDEDAQKEYADTAYSVGLLAPLGAVGRFSERASAREDVARRQAEQAQQDAQQQQLAQQQALLGAGVGGVDENYAAQQALLSQYQAHSNELTQAKQQRDEAEKGGDLLTKIGLDEKIEQLEEKEKGFHEQAGALNLKLGDSGVVGATFDTIDNEVARLLEAYNKAKTPEDKAQARAQLRDALTRQQQLKGMQAPAEGEEVPPAEGFTAPAAKKKGKKKAEEAVVEEPPAILVGPVVPARYTPEFSALVKQRLDSLETETEKPKGVGLQGEKNRQANLFGAFNTLLEDARNLEYSKTDEELAEDQKDAALNDLNTVQDRLNTLKDRFIESAVSEVKLAREEAGAAPVSEKEMSDMTDKMDRLLTEIGNRTATPNYNKRAGEAVDPDQERFNFSTAERRRLMEAFGLDENVDRQLAILTREINKRSGAAASLGSLPPSKRTAASAAAAEQNAPEIRRLNAEIDSLYKDRAELLLNNLRAQLARIKNEVAYAETQRPGIEEAAAGAKAKVEQRATEEEERLSQRKVVSPVEKPIPLQVTEEDKAAIDAAKKAVDDAVTELRGMRESGATAEDIRNQQTKIESLRTALTEARGVPGQRLRKAKGERRAAELGKTVERETATREDREAEQRELEALFNPSRQTSAQAALDSINATLERGYLTDPKRPLGKKGQIQVLNRLKTRKAALEKKIKAEKVVKAEEPTAKGLSPLARAQRETRVELAQDIKNVRKILFDKKATPKEKQEAKDTLKKLRGKIKKGAVSFETAVPKLMQAGRELAKLKKRGSEIQQILSSQIDFARKRSQLLADAAQARKEGNKELADEMKAERLALEKGRPNVAKLQAEYEQISKQIRDIENRPATKEEEQEIAAQVRKTRTQKVAEEIEVAEPVDELDVLRETIGDEFSLDSDGNVYRRGAAENPVDEAEAKSLIDGIKPPEGVKFVYSYTYDGLPQEVKDQLPDDGDTKGAVLPDGTVVVIGEAHSNTVDMEKTVAHEVVGHYGVDTVLGPKGMKDLTDRTMRMEGGIQKLAESFGKDVGEATLSTAIYYQRMADQARAEGNEKRAKELEELGRIQAMRELIAHVEETRPTAGFLQKANRFIKELVGSLRAALRKMGLKSFGLDKVSSSDIYKILRDARNSVGKASAGVYVSPTNEIAFRKQAASYSANISQAAQRATDIVGSNRKSVQDVLANNAGLRFVTKFVDRFAPLERVAAFMKDAAQATQMMYFLRMHDQGIAWTQAVLTKGPLKLVKDNKGYLMLQTGDGPNIKKMVEALKDANVGNPEATKKLFTTYLLAERAEIVGYDKLKSDLGIGVSHKDLKEVLDLGRKNAAFQEAKKIYNEHNNGLIDALVDSGAMSKEDAAKLKNKSYVPYYRIDKNGEVNMFLGGEGTVRIGDIKNQPYLHELVGGNEKILDVFASSVQNTRLLTDMALRNLATRNAAFGLQSAGMLRDDAIRDGDGPASPDVIRFKLNGEKKYAVVDSDKAGIPAELLVSGMEGIRVAMPVLVRTLSAPAGILRKFITRNPVYAMRQIVRDSTTNYFLTGTDSKPIGSAAANMYKLFRNKRDGSMPDLQSRGIVSGNVLTGTSEQMEDILLNMVSGKPGWEQYMAKLDIMAQHADEASRISIYNDFIKQGLSDMEATMATLESMNFNKRGTSPSLFMLNAMVPFLNAQVQGLNVLQKSLRGKMPFAERLKQRKKLANRAMFLAASTVAYSLMMSDDEAYETSDPADRYNNWFVRVPGLDEPVRIPIPFEVGLLFKAIPEAMMDYARGDAKAEQAVYGMKRLLTNATPLGPSSLPAGIKPIVELTLGSSFYSGLPIESAREKQLLPEYRTREKTTEVAKSLGSLLGVSPIQVDYLINGYLSSTGLALAGMGNFILRAPDAPQQAEKTLSEMPVIGALFQTNTGSGYVNTFYRQAQQIEQAKATFDALIKKGDADGATRLVETSARDIALDGFVSNIKQQLTDLRDAEKAIRASDMNPAEKAKTIKDLRISASALTKAANQAVASEQ
jgi:translation initiation factor 2B subunit (eIF-2B alpha/beta/delta family)